ncbi:hypothetical protein QBC47DRAFT_349954 [Echria macrotheca]|uniref:Microbial-type PARG catalytic domain-containing protein n=1 Tax=Echria macrotheca TaxID=438768 RepID=A0AAJ0F8E4_9PEZI|nr:hypothetical protein QBC47DRAFT_349954 [Echria macrotheca]
MQNQSYQARRRALADIAKETIALTPTIAASLPHLALSTAVRLDLSTLPPLDPTKCPRYTLPSDPSLVGTTIRVLPSDSFDAAIAMPSTILGPAPATLHSTAEIESHRLAQLKSLSLRPENVRDDESARVAVLNMASDKTPGGGWLGGAAAQEEALCFRSSLASSLDRGFYPIPDRSGVYTRDVVVFRTAMADGHGLMTAAGVEETRLPVVSVLSVAGIRRPPVRSLVEAGGVRRAVFARDGDRELTKDKMRLCLRMAGMGGHAMVVLGALGCGAFRNPAGEVAACWGEVLGEEEFSGGWFREVWFAVYDRKGDGNLPVFEEALDGRRFGVRTARE